MWSWLTGGLKAVIADIEVVKADLGLAQAMITKLSGGYLTAQKELELLRLALAAAHIVVPVVPAATELEVATFLNSVKEQVAKDAASSN